MFKIQQCASILGPVPGLLILFCLKGAPADVVMPASPLLNKF